MNCNPVLPDRVHIFCAFLTGVLFHICVSAASAQVVSLYDVIYRPPGENWLVVNDGSFEIIYPDRHERQAGAMLKVLQETRKATDAFLGVDRPYSLTAILSDQSDAGNGFVTPFPYKTEINAIALRGRGLSRRHHSWMEVVTAHELVHAAQAEFRIQKSLTGLAGVFAPDFARALSLFQPSGVVEGLAVYRESQIPPEAGRLNHPYFVMQARAGMMESGGWSLSQALEQPSYTRPFDRFYKGGALYIDFLTDVYGDESIVSSLRWQQHIPFSGYGSNLRLALGRSPGQVERDFQSWFAHREDSTRRAIGTLSPSTMVVGRKGQTHRRPFWLNDSTILTFALGYDLPRGFQQVDLDGRMMRRSWNEITDDAVAFVSPSGKEVLYSRYSEHPYAPESKTSWSYRMDLETGKEVRLEGSGHTYNPVRTSSGQLLALRSFGQYNRIVDITSGEQIARLDMPSVEIVAMSPRPESDSLVVIAKTGAHQAAFLVDTSEETWSLSPWIGFQQSTIYDGSWDDSGRYFSFTSDRTGIMNIHVLDAWTEQLVQVTNVLYGAMEGHVGPDGQTVVFVEYGQEQFDLKTAPLEGPWVVTVNRDLANGTWNTNWQEAADNPDSHPAADSLFKASRRYRSWQHVKPRMVYPTFYLDDERKREADARLGLGIGMAMQGTDPLQRIAWYSEGIIQKNRLWGEVGVQSAHVAFRPGVKVERRPTTVDAVIQGQAQIQRVVRDRISWTASAYLPYTIEQNVHRTSVISSVALSYRSDRFLDDDLQVLQERRGRLALQPSLFFGHKMLRNPRDIWPTSGQFISWFGDLELNRDVGQKRRGSVTLLNAYVPILRRSNTSIRLDAGHLYQNLSGIFGLTFFKPVGWSDAPIGNDHYSRFGLRVRQPIAFPDDGWLTIPVYVRTIYLRAGTEMLVRLDDTDQRYSSISLGIGAKIRLWHIFDMDLSYDVGYRLQTKDWDTVWNTISEN